MKKPFVLLAMLVLVVLASCNPSKIEDARKALLQFAQSQKTEAAFYFRTVESDSGLTTALLNKAVGQQVVFGRGDTTLLIGIYGFQANGKDTPTIFKSQLSKRDSILTLEIVDATGKTLEKFVSKAPGDGTPDPNPPGYDSFQECLDDYFDSPAYADLQKKANQTCKTQFGFVLCCLKNGNCAYFDFIQVPPTRLNCKFRIALPDIPIVRTL